MTYKEGHPDLRYVNKPPQTKSNQKYYDSNMNNDNHMLTFNEI